MLLIWWEYDDLVDHIITLVPGSWVNQVLQAVMSSLSKGWWKGSDPRRLNAGFILQRGRREMKKLVEGKCHVRHGH